MCSPCEHININIIITTSTMVPRWLTRAGISALYLMKNDQVLF